VELYSLFCLKGGDGSSSSDGDDGVVEAAQHKNILQNFLPFHVIQIYLPGLINSHYK
jgi:hypothetical protein